MTYKGKKSIKNVIVSEERIPYKLETDRDRCQSVQEGGVVYGGWPEGWECGHEGLDLDHQR